MPERPSRSGKTDVQISCSLSPCPARRAPRAEVACVLRVDRHAVKEAVRKFAVTRFRHITRVVEDEMIADLHTITVLERTFAVTASCLSSHIPWRVQLAPSTIRMLEHLTHGNTSCFLFTTPVLIMQNTWHQTLSNNSQPYPHPSIDKTFKYGMLILVSIRGTALRKESLNSPQGLFCVEAFYNVWYTAYYTERLEGIAVRYGLELTLRRLFIECGSTPLPSVLKNFPDNHRGDFYFASKNKNNHPLRNQTFDKLRGGGVR